MDSFKNYYEVLGLSFSSNPEPELIAAAYKAKLKLYHPDVYKKKKGEQLTKDINEAYETLSNKSKKKVYDKVYKKYYSLKEKDIENERIEKDFA